MYKIKIVKRIFTLLCISLILIIPLFSGSFLDNPQISIDSMTPRLSKADVASEYWQVGGLTGDSWGNCVDEWGNPIASSPVLQLAGTSNEKISLKPYPESSHEHAASGVVNPAKFTQFTIAATCDHNPASYWGLFKTTIETDTLSTFLFFDIPIPGITYSSISATATAQAYNGFSQFNYLIGWYDGAGCQAQWIGYYLDPTTFPKTFTDFAPTGSSLYFFMARIGHVEYSAMLVFEASVDYYWNEYKNDINLTSPQKEFAWTKSIESISIQADSPLDKFHDWQYRIKDPGTTLWGNWIPFTPDGSGQYVLPEETLARGVQWQTKIDRMALQSNPTTLKEVKVSYRPWNLEIVNHKENGINVLPGCFQIDETEDFNITLTYGTKIGESTYTWTNSTLYYRINNNPWNSVSYGYFQGINSSSYIITSDEYVLHNQLEYFFYFQQYTDASNTTLIYDFYWTVNGLKFSFAQATTNSFLKSVGTILYNLSLSYSVWYQAEKATQIKNEQGLNITIYPLYHLAYQNISVSFTNTTDVDYAATFINAPNLNHSIDSVWKNISRTQPPVINPTAGIRSPFIFPIEKDYSAIQIPQISFSDKTSNATLLFSGVLMTLMSTVNEAFPYQFRMVKCFEGTNAKIKYDAYTGIMVYFKYWDNTENASEVITFTLIDNNKHLPINLDILKKHEIIDQDFWIIPDYLTGILYDPPGDHSFSELTSQTTVTYGFELGASAGQGTYSELELCGGLGLVVGGGADISQETKTSIEFDFETEITFTKKLTSSQNSEDSEFIGPGRGDLYYGWGLIIIVNFMVDNYYIKVGNEETPNEKVFQNSTGIEFGLNISAQFNVLGAYLESYSLSDVSDTSYFSDYGYSYNKTDLKHFESYNIFADNRISLDEEDFVVELEGESPCLWTPEFYEELSFSKTSTSTQSWQIEVSSETSYFGSWHAEVSAGAPGAEALVFKTDGKIGMKFDFSTTSKTTTSTSENHQIMCHFEDDDGTPIGQHDQFLVHIYEDTRYNTYGFTFEEDYTYTSYPYEPGTRDRRPPTNSEIINVNEFARGIIDLQCWALDQETGVNYVAFFYDSTPVYNEYISNYIGYQSTPQSPNLYKVSWNTTGLHGTYYVFAVVVDKASPVINERVSTPYIVFIDNELPSNCEVRAYKPYRNAIELYAYAFDDDSGIACVEFWDGDPTNPNSILLGISYSSDTSYRIIWTTDPGGTDDGTHNIYARTYDQAGNSLISAEFTIKVDNAMGNFLDSVQAAIPVILLGGMITIGVVGGIFYVRDRRSFRRHLEKIELNMKLKTQKSISTTELNAKGKEKTN